MRLLGLRPGFRPPFGRIERPNAVVQSNFLLERTFDHEEAEFAALGPPLIVRLK